MPIFGIYMDPYKWMVATVSVLKHNYEFIEWTENKGKKEKRKYLVKELLYSYSVKGTKKGELLINPEYSRKERRPIQSNVL